MQKLTKVPSAALLLAVSMLLLSLLVTRATSLPTAVELPQAEGEAQQAATEVEATAAAKAVTANKDVLVPLQPDEPSVFTKTCALLGEYCITSEACCSKRCLSYAAKCFL